jgi:hypothetical protein
MANVETAMFQWQQGQRRLRAADPADRRVLERVTDRIVAELRRRLGGAFTTVELAELYDQGTDWCLDLAVATAPDQPMAWDSQIVCDAAFARYLREAADFAGGRVTARD